MSWPGYSPYSEWPRAHSDAPSWQTHSDHSYASYKDSPYYTGSTDSFGKDPFLARSDPGLRVPPSPVHSARHEHRRRRSDDRRAARRQRTIVSEKESIKSPASRSVTIWVCLGLIVVATVAVIVVVTIVARKPSASTSSPSSSASRSTSGSPASPTAPSTSNNGTGMNLVTAYDPQSFLDESSWTYFTAADPTGGTVQFLSLAAARQAGLAKLDSNSYYVAAVDSASNLQAGQKRNSIRLNSVKPFTQGQLLVADIEHMPVGCSTWPAFWSTGPRWPSQGEIDILEGIQAFKANQMTLHTTSGCTIKQPMAATGKVLEADCNAAGENVGCGVQDTSMQSWGAPFNDNSGGVFATYWSASSIAIWFWPRQSIPADVSSGNPDPSSWSEPSALWDFSTCAPSHFGPQTIVLNTTLCGSWAGSVYGQGDGCPGSCAAAVQDPSNFAQAYWTIRSMAVYE